MTGLDQVLAVSEFTQLDVDLGPVGDAPFAEFSTILVFGETYQLVYARF